MGARAALAVAAFIGGVTFASPAWTAEPSTPPAQGWTFDSIFGELFDRAALQRGFQVYNEVCSACHGLKRLYYRNILEIGFDEEQVKAFAAERDVIDGPDVEGEMFDRPARLTDRIVSPFPNDNAARAANNGALPPDLSLMVKARMGGADYVYALLTGFKEEPPEDAEELLEGMYYNEYFRGNQIAMAPPLDDDLVEYADGTEATVNQMARDVTEFLAWTAKPELEARKRMGIRVILFLLVLTGMLYAVKRKVWSDVH